MGPGRTVKHKFNTIVLSGFVFFFQAEDGIRDYKVTGVQTCALPISTRSEPGSPSFGHRARWLGRTNGASCAGSFFSRLGSERSAVSTGSEADRSSEIGRASCRERV